jgi:TatD DNase family protein
VPHRGQTCEPSYVSDTVRFIADLRGLKTDGTLQEHTARNFHRLFAKTGL